MILHPPVIEFKNGEVIISSIIEPQALVPGFPERLWYSFPEKWGQFLTDRTDAFALATFAVAMLLNEPLHIGGKTSAMLAYGLQQYQAIFNLWFPKIYHRIDITFDQLQVGTTMQVNPIQAVGASFSGGVDSMFTLWHHLPPQVLHRDHQVTHLVYIFGQNSDYQIRDSIRQITQNLHALVAHLDLELIEATCNMRDFLPFFPLMLLYQATLLGVPLALGGLFRRYYVPSDGYTGAVLAKRGSSPVLDHFANTETLTFIHHGWAFTRVDKLKTLAGWELARHNLRVCDDPHTNEVAYNCSKCEKCTHTMNIIVAVSDLKQFPTFQPRLRLRNYLDWGLHYEFETRGISDPLQACIANKKYQVIPLLWFTWLIAHLKVLFSLILPSVLKREVKKVFYPYLRKQRHSNP